MRIDVYHHSILADTERQLDRIEFMLSKLLGMGRKQMALGQDILDAVTAETTVLDSFIALIQGLIDNNTIPAAVGAQILTAVNTNKAKIDKAILDNTPQAPPVEP